MTHTFDYKNLKDPQYFRDGRLDAHSDHKYYASMSDIENDREDFKKSLNGIWKFHYAKNYSSSISGFEKTDYCCKNWDDIHVPAHIQMEGYDVPQYTNVQFPWEGHEEIHPGEIPESFNPTASYVKYFTIPERMLGRRIFISFQGAESGLALWLNGIFIGYSEDSFTPSEFELTDHIIEKENKLAVQVFKWTSSSWCEDQDFYRFSGIYRDVYLYTIPDIHVRDMKICAIPDKSLVNGKLDILLDMMFSGEHSGGIAAFRLEKDGHLIFEEKKQLNTDFFGSWLIEKPALWSAEEPNLYNLIIEIYNSDGVLQEIISEKIGFRRFEINDHIMMLNGKRIVFKGVNRHEFSSVNGRHISEKELRTDLEIMKQNNINAIRTCHYPDGSLLYRLCDEYGIYLIDENNLESHGTWDVSMVTRDFTNAVPNDRYEWLDMILDRANSMYQRDKNHPAILIWSCGNESFGGKDIYEISQLFRRLDPNRIVHYEGVHHDRRYNDTSDIESQMYPSVKEIKEFLDQDKNKPFICCEYTHAMGNSCGAMHKYTDLTDTEPQYQGGFIWDFIDQSIYKKDRYGNEFHAYGGDFGDRPTDYHFSGNGIIYGNRKVSPKMQEIKFNYQNITAEVSKTQVKVINKNLFVNTDTFECLVTVARDGHIIRKAVLHTYVEPLSEEIYTLPVPNENLPGEYSITVSFHLAKDKIWAQKGHEIAFGQYIYQIQRPKKVCHKNVKIIKSTHNIGVRGEHFEALFSLLSGGLVSYKFAGKEMLETIPKVNFWRAPVDNDCGNQMPVRYGHWKLASMYISHRALGADMFALCTPEIEESDNSVSVTFTYHLHTTPAAECFVTYKVFGDGLIKTSLSYDPVKELGDMPEFGMLFRLNADYDHVKWYGLGPAETYADRKNGAKLGIYENLVKDNMADYLIPQECGNKEGVRYAEITDRKGRGLKFEMTAENGPMCFSALPYTPHEMENAMHIFELPKIHYTVIRIAKAQMGISGDDSWGSFTHPEYLININKKLEFSFYFHGIS